MKITRLRATPVNIPLEAPYHWSYGLLSGFTQTIIEVETDQGITGIGEAPGAGSAALVNGRFTQTLIGRDPIDLIGAELRCLSGERGVQSFVDFGARAAFGGVEMALWDIRGKAWGEPLYRLLGGAVRKDIAFADYFAYRPKSSSVDGESTTEEIADYCERLRQDHGTTIFEGKVSSPDPSESIRMIAALRKRLGDSVTIRIDSNHAYSVAAARKLAPAFEELGVANWEDPVGTWEEMARLRPHTRLRLSSHNTDLPKAVALGVPDTLVTGIAAHGGIAATQRFIAACEAMAIGFWCYSGDSGVASAAYLHLLAATPWARHPSQSLFRMQPIDVIAEGPFRPASNVIRVPEGPGLGVTLDHSKLGYCHELFQKEGACDKYINPGEPGVFRRLPFV